MHATPRNDTPLSDNAETPRKRVSARPNSKVSKPISAASDLNSEDLQEAEEQIETGLDELIIARAEADELRERYLRLQAEWDNYRKRTTQERAEERSRAAAHLVERLLPVIDDIERAIEHSDATSEASLKEGIQAVHAKFIDVLEREGVLVINPLGEPFDANLHSAMGLAEDDSVDEDTIVQVYQKGYEMAGRLLRPAMVIVSKK